MTNGSLMTPASTMTISPWTMDADVRQAVRHVIDVLLPGFENMPSGLDIGVENELLDRVMAADPQLVPPMLAVCERVARGDAPTVLAEFVDWCGDEFEQVAFAINAAYYMSATVRAAIGYPGQRRQPVSAATPDQLVSDELLAPVVERGPIYVPTPGSGGV